MKQRYGVIETNDRYTLTRDRNRLGELFYVVKPVSPSSDAGTYEIHSTIHKARKAMQEDPKDRATRHTHASINARPAY